MLESQYFSVTKGKDINKAECKNASSNYINEPCLCSNPPKPIMAAMSGWTSSGLCNQERKTYKQSTERISYVCG
jgi:hypothetical protein